MDGVLVANEYINAMVKNGKSGILCKLDLEKAYNKVNWDFLDYMLRRMGFGKKLRKWMKKCYGSGHFSVQVNGTTMEHYHGSHELRQGDSLSPFLFLDCGKSFRGSSLQSFSRWPPRRS